MQKCGMCLLYIIMVLLCTATFGSRNIESCTLSLTCTNSLSHTHLPHPNAFSPEEVLQLLRVCNVRTHDHLSLVVCRTAWVGLAAVDERCIHLQLREGTAHSVCVKNRKTLLGSKDQRLQRVDSSNLPTHQVSDTLGLERGVEGKIQTEMQ